MIASLVVYSSSGLPLESFGPPRTARTTLPTNFGVSNSATLLGGAIGGLEHREPDVVVLLEDDPDRQPDADLVGFDAVEVAGEPEAVLLGPVSELVLSLHRRVPLDRVRVEGDHELAERLFAWPSLD